MKLTYNVDKETLNYISIENIDIEKDIIDEKITIIINYENEYITTIGNDNVDFLILSLKEKEKISKYAKEIKIEFNTHPKFINKISIDSTFNIPISITIPDSVVHIGRYAFEKQIFNDIDFLELGEPILLDKGCFSNCIFNNKLIITKRCSSIKSYAFFKSEFKKGIDFQADIISIEEYTFSETNFYGNNVIFPQSLKYIKERAFYKAKRLLGIEFPEKTQILAIGPLAFLGIEIEELILNTNEKIILEEKAFFNCINLKKVDLSQAKIEIIPKACFKVCEKLKSVKLPETIKKIQDRAFKRCSIEEINIPLSIKEISMGAFASNKLKSLPHNILTTLNSIGTEAFARNNFDELVLEAPQKSCKIGTNIFGYNNNLKTVKLLNTKANSWKEIPYGIFRDCKELSKLEVPSSIEQLKSHCFENTGLKTIRFPNLKRIESFSFFNCTELIECDFTGSVFSKLNGKTFAYCEKLEKVILPVYLNEVKIDDFEGLSIDIIEKALKDLIFFDYDYYINIFKLPF